jgi:hypothetical protein
MRSFLVIRLGWWSDCSLDAAVIDQHSACGIGHCYDTEVGENRVRVFYGTEKREGERLEIYTGGISPCSSDRVSDL